MGVEAYQRLVVVAPGSRGAGSLPGFYQGGGGAIPAGKVPPVALAYRTSTVINVRKAYSYYPKIGSVIALDPKSGQ